MAYLTITRPQASQRIAIENVENARIVLNFSPADAILERDGDNLVFKFEDGGEVVFTGFYTAYTSENLPTFQIDGAELDGKDFFAALDESLMPAAGPAARAADGARFREYDESTLMNGIDRLDGLDIGFTGVAQVAEENLGGLGGLIDLGAPAAATVPTIDTPLTPPIAPVEYDALANLHFSKVYEGALENGSKENPASQADFTTSSLLTGLPAGWTIVGGKNDNGELIKNDDDSWSYKLNSSQQIHSSDEHYDTASDTVDITVRDPYGREVTIAVNVDIVDDAPILSSVGEAATDIKPGGLGEGSLTLTEGADGVDWSTFTINGKPVTLKDGTGTVQLGGDTLNLSLSGNTLNYTYIASDSSGTQDVKLDIAFKDNDGDEATQTVTVTVRDSAPSIGGLAPGVDSANITADEANIDSNNAMTDIKTFTFTAPDGLVSATINGESLLDENGALSKNFTGKGEYGTLHITEVSGPSDDGTYTVSYQYEITSSAQHADGDYKNTQLAEDAAQEAFKVVITDRGSSTPATGSIIVDIKDDVPSLSVGETAAAIKPGGSGEGSLTLTEGADGVDWSTFTINGKPVTLKDGTGTVQLGGDTLNLSLSGNTLNYTYIASDSSGTQDVDLAIAFKDNDGDEAAQTVTVKVQDSTPSIGGLAPGVDSAKVTADEANIGINNAMTEEKTFTFTAPDGLVSATINGKSLLDENGALSNDFTSQGEYGTLHITDVSGPSDDGTYTVSYQYEITSSAQHAKGEGTNTQLAEGAAQESFELVITDKGSSDPATGSIIVDIVDDVPSLSVDGDLQVQEGGTTTTGKLTFDFGADDGEGKTFTVTVNGGVSQKFTLPDEDNPTTIKAGWGTLTVNADGSYSYTATANRVTDTAKDTFQFTITDADGDSATNILNVTVKDSGISANNGSVTVAESDLVTGTDSQNKVDSTPTNQNANESTFSGALQHNYGNAGPNDNGFMWDSEGLSGVKAMVNGEWQNVTWKVSDDGTSLTGTAKGETVFSVTMGDGGNYTGSINAAFKHEAPDNNAGGPDESLTLNLGFTIKDANGNTADGSLAVTVVDDTPVFSESSSDVLVTQTPENDLFQADESLKFTKGNAKDFEGKSTVDMNDITISSAIVHYNEQGVITKTNTDDGGTLHFKNPTNETRYHGLGVKSDTIDDALSGKDTQTDKSRFSEINYNHKDQTSEAIVLDLGGKVAYGMNIGLSNFFSDSQGEASEIAQFTFYLNGEIVSTTTLTSNQQNGLVNGTLNTINSGFDKVVISAAHNKHSDKHKDNSDFTITSVQFVTASGEPVATATGTVSAISADGIASYMFGSMENLLNAEGKSIDVTHAQSSDGYGDHIYGKVGNDIVFEAMLDTNGKWTLLQYQHGIKSKNNDDFTLNFVAKDKDGDTTDLQVTIPPTPPETDDGGGTPDDDAYKVVWGSNEGINKVELPDGTKHNTNNNQNDDAKNIQELYNAKGGDDTLQLQGKKGLNNDTTIIEINKNGEILLPVHTPGKDTPPGTATFQNFEHVIGNTDNDKYTLKLDEGMKYSIDADNEVTVYYQDNGTEKSITFDCVASGKDGNPIITGGTVRPLAAEIEAQQVDVPPSADYTVDNNSSDLDNTDQPHAARSFRASSFHAIKDTAPDDPLQPDSSDTAQDTLPDQPIEFLIFYDGIDEPIFTNEPQALDDGEENISPYGDPHDVSIPYIGDLFADDGDTMDILLDDTADPTDRTNLLQTEPNANVEMLIPGDKMVNLTDMDQSYDKLGIPHDRNAPTDTGENRSVVAPETNVAEVGSGTPHVEYSNEEAIAIAIQQNLIKSDSGCA